MKKKLLIALTALILTSAFGISYAKTTVNSDLAEAIKMYKAGNYSGCYEKLETAIKKDPSNALGYYYKAMTSAQIGKKAEAIENYEKALSVAPSNSNLTTYAEKGLRCLNEPEKCHQAEFESDIDRFIRSKGGARFTDQVRSDYERLKIENMMREMNRSDDIDPRRFKDYKDFSSMNTDGTMPSNDEIVAAIRTLQKAGIYTGMDNGILDLSLLTGENRNNAMLNMMGNSSLSPQVIQAMLTNNMSLGF